jgi:acetylornithine deacetylase/succinyl-diaminopimelate desuccinylase-like protein
MTPHDYARQHAEEFRAQLLDFLRIPSVSTDEAYKPEVRRAAEWLAAEMQRIGITTELIDMPGRHPLVYGEWMGAGENARTVLIYGHYDVQPAKKADGWDTEPFEPVEKDGFIWARGATDDKGQVYIHVKAVEAVLKAEGTLPVNVKFIIEGEEESGGQHIAAYVPQHVDKLKADVCVVSDGSMSRVEQPVIVNALRGGIGLEITIHGPSADVHSGMYGGTLHNPNQALAEIIAKLHNPDGSVAVPGFYEDVRVLTPQERAEIAAVPWTDDEWRSETGAQIPWGEPDYTLSERVGARPTLEITGMAGGYYERGFKNIVPSKAWAKISCRLVPDQKPHKILHQVVEYIKQITPPTVRLELAYREGGGIEATLINTNNPMMQAAINAYEKGWGGTPVFKREGGGIPIVGAFQNVLGLPVLLMGFGLNTDGLHGPNEHFSIDMFHRGINTIIVFLNEVAQI